MANILAVDDDEDMRALLQAALGRDGHTVKTLACGAAGSNPRRAAGRTASCWT